MYQKLAAYLDEADEDPIAACKTLAAFGIKNVVLRYTWGGKNICETSDHACQKIKTALSDHNLDVVAVISNAGESPAHHIFADEALLDRAFLMAEYFKASYVRVSCGSISTQDVQQPINDWMKLVTEKSIASGVVPLLELSKNAHHFAAATAISLLSNFKRWQFLYDPVQFVLDRKIDPYVKYWVLIQQRTAAIDVRDLKIGRGYKPVGFGDTRIVDTLRDVVDTGKQWMLLEPSLGRRYGQQVTKSGSFGLAYDALKIALGESKTKLEK